MDRTFEIEVREANGIVDLAVHEEDVAQYGEQVSKELLSRFENFDINVLRRERGVKLELINPPEDALRNS
jgi:hypothetical protein